MDKVAHFIVGAVLYIVLVKRGYPKFNALVGVLGLALFKEFVIDLSVLINTGNGFESFMDILATMVVPVIGSIPRRMHRRRFL